MAVFFKGLIRRVVFLRSGADVFVAEVSAATEKKTQFEINPTEQSPQIICGESQLINFPKNMISGGECKRHT